jgi:hypothetical protein
MANGDPDDRVGVGRGRQNGAGRCNGNGRNARASPCNPRRAVPPAGPVPPTGIALGAPGQGLARVLSRRIGTTGTGRSKCRYHAGDFAAGDDLGLPRRRRRGAAVLDRPGVGAQAAGGGDGVAAANGPDDDGWRRFVAKDLRALLVGGNIFWISGQWLTSIGG